MSRRSWKRPRPKTYPAGRWYLREWIPRLVSILVLLGLVFDVIEFFPTAAVILLVSIAVDYRYVARSPRPAQSPVASGGSEPSADAGVLQVRQAVTQTSIVAA